MAIHIDKNQPFHIASVGKSFTATLIGCLIDDDLIRLDDKINKYLHDTTIDGLFIVNDKDYKDDVIIRHLLNHTSGVANYFDDETSHALPMKNLILQDKEKRWTPQNLLSFSRDYQKAVSPPGKTYHYSDTGYILLGLIIEQISEKSFDQMLQIKIFGLLEMNDSYLMFYSNPANKKKTNC